MSERRQNANEMEVDEGNTDPPMDMAATSTSEKPSAELASPNSAFRVMATSGTVGSVSISLHPLVIMNISEHWTRLRAQEGSDQLGNWRSTLFHNTRRIFFQLQTYFSNRNFPNWSVFVFKWSSFSRKNEFEKKGFFWRRSQTKILQICLVLKNGPHFQWKMNWKKRKKTFSFPTAFSKRNSLNWSVFEKWSSFSRKNELKKKV